MLGKNNMSDKELNEFSKALDKVDIKHLEANFFVDATREKMLEFIVKQNNELKGIKFLIDELKIYSSLFDVRQAHKIVEHWETLNKFLEENPTLKEEWEALCMAIRLTEE